MTEVPRPKVITAVAVNIAIAKAVLDAETRRGQAQLSYAQALAQLGQYYVALQKSLGLGWVDTGAS